MRVGVQVCYNIWRVPLCMTHVNQLSFHKYLACLQDSSSLFFNFWKLKDFKDLMKKMKLLKSLTPKNFITPAPSSSNTYPQKN